MKYLQQFEYLTRGAQEIIEPDSLEKCLYNSEKSGNPLNIKFGTDPTTNSLHLGHMVPIHLLKKFEDLGHNTYFLIGDFTARIGDPAGRSTKRIELSKDKVDNFSVDYFNQVNKILDFSKTKLVKNSSWFEQMSLYEFVMKIASKYTVAQLLARDDFNTRYSSQIPIHLSEFLYPLLQAYDSVVLGINIEIGGNDQLFNFLVARELQKQFKQDPQCIITLPTIRGLDGKEKMSKSLGNVVNVLDNPFEMYSKIMSINDETMIEWLGLLSSCDENYIKNVKKGNVHPKTAKQKLASEITSKYYSEEDSKKAEEKFNYQFGKSGGIPEDVETITVPTKKPLNLVDLVYSTGLIKSKSGVRRLINQRGIRINGVRVTELNQTYALDTNYILSIGKRRHMRIELTRDRL